MTKACLTIYESNARERRPMSPIGVQTVPSELVPGCRLFPESHLDIYDDKMMRMQIPS